MRIALGLSLLLLLAALLIWLWRSGQPEKSPEIGSPGATVARQLSHASVSDWPNNAESGASDAGVVDRSDSTEVSDLSPPETPSRESDAHADAIADERRKIINYSAMKKMADMARARIRVVEANVAVQRGLFPGAPHLVDLEQLLDSEWAEVDLLDSEVSRFAEQNRILDLADLPPAERDAVLFVNDPNPAAER